MKAIIKVQKEVDITTLVAVFPLEDFGDAEFGGEFNGEIPCKEGSTVKFIISFDTGVILNWTKGVTSKFHQKVVDCGSYYLLDSDYNTVIEREESYVPKCLCPARNGFGDYVIMNVDANGQIENYKPDFDRLIEDEEE